MIKILIDGSIFEFYPHGGIARYFREILTRIVKKSIDIHFFVTISEKYAMNLPAHSQIHPIFFHPLRLRPTRLFKHLDEWRLKKFKQSIKDLSPQIFHSTYYTLSPFEGMKNVVTVYDLIDYQYPLIHPNDFDFVFRQGIALKAADQIISISQTTAHLTAKAFAIESGKISTITLGASDIFTPSTDREKTEFKAKHTNGKSFFLFVGYTGTYKNLATLIRAFGLVAKSTDHCLVLAGHSMKTMEHWLIDLAIQHRVEERITVLNHPTDATLKTAYGAATAFVFPSLQEGFGIPLLEAMQCECEIIASDIPVFREICDDAASYFDPHDPDALASCMLSSLNIKDKNKANLSRKSRLTQFTWDDAAMRTEKIYRDLAGNAANP